MRNGASSEDGCLESPVPPDKTLLCLTAAVTRAGGRGGSRPGEGSLIWDRTEASFVSPPGPGLGWAGLGWAIVIQISILILPPSPAALRSVSVSPAPVSLLHNLALIITPPRLAASHNS